MGGTGDGGGMIRRTVDAAKSAPTLTTAIAFVIAIPSVIAGLTAIGIDPIPWSGKANQSALERLDGRVAELERELWQDRLDQANEEIAANPNSRAALRDKVEAEQKLRQILRFRRSQP